MRTLITTTLGALLLAANPAVAAPPIVTPAIQNSATGTLSCWVVNASASKTIAVSAEIRTFTGTVVESGEVEIPPLEANGIVSSSSQARFCVVRVLRGGRKNAVVSLVGLESGSPVAVVQANR